jgi:hypothetical protein
MEAMERYADPLREQFPEPKLPPGCKGAACPMFAVCQGRCAAKLALKEALAQAMAQKPN